ncbi:MAG: rod shape-determining protein RodA [Planctomycetes bacterium]|nr:rod shape-determining protein RodA [Planctomycetota bacterium]MBU2457493.1 rod shape-determining protein RodA [Planctomycetota bacterium]
MFDFIKGRQLSTRLVMLAAAAGLVAIGLMMIYASGNPADSGSNISSISGMWKKQAAFAAIGFIAFVIINSFNYKRLGPASFWLYTAILILLALLLLDKVVNLPFIPVKKGSRRWILIGSLFQFQPSEFFKLVYIIALGWHLRYRSNYRNFSALVPPFILTFLPMILILLEPDLGTVLLMMPVFLSMLFIAGAKTKHLAAIIVLALLAFPILWMGMHDYQRMRISSVLLQSDVDGSESWFKTQSRTHPWLGKMLGVTPERLRNWEVGEGYQLTRSKLAIASGRLSGQGYRSGPFIRYRFLPDRHNDFIFALVCHQWGFAGAVLVIGLYALLIACSLEIAAASSDIFGSYLAAGISIIFAIQVLVNISMTIGIMPITGITLPFISYGGSSLLVNLLSVGLVNNIGRR